MYVTIDFSIGVVVVLLTFIQYFCLRLACRNIVATLRHKFIESVLRQEASWFDKQKFGAINSQLNEYVYFNLILFKVTTLYFSGIKRIEGTF
jgi:ABC-type multidrug transport system fused ATPase/permease subunit